MFFRIRPLSIVRWTSFQADELRRIRLNIFTVNNIVFQHQFALCDWIRFVRMSVRVQLDRQNGEIYTNLDFVTGRVFLTLPNDTAITAITVKLEAESKTRLDGPKSPNDQDRRKTLLEVHKLLYKIETVFPSQEVREAGNPGARAAQYTLQRGQYEYPFQFKVPFNNDCVNNTSLMKDLKVGQLRVEFGQEPIHGKYPLPPTLHGYPGEAEIKYYIKATVVRPKFYQENLRCEIPIIFLPIEQPRSTAQSGETYGRRKHQFQKTDAAVIKKSFFSKSSPVVPEEESLAFQIDARLPNPAIVTCRQPIPLRILVEKLNNSSSSIFLSTLQIELIGTTEIRAHDLQRKESGTWLLFSQANMSIPLEQASNKTNQWTIPSYFWDNVPLPPTVAPTFKTCNISRKYELEVRVGLSHAMADGIRPEIIVSPIRLEVEVYSGIRPPVELVQRQSMHLSNSNRRPNPNIPHLDTKHDSRIAQSSSSPPVSPSHPQYHTPQRPPASVFSGDDLPPSYEDAMATDLAPVDGPRPTGYASEGLQEQPAFNADSKSSLGRRVSERLFSSNAPNYNRSNRPSGDMSQFGGDVVPEESDETTNSFQQMNLNSSTVDEYRPPLPVRRPSGPGTNSHPEIHPPQSKG